MPGLFGGSSDFGSTQAQNGINQAIAGQTTAAGGIGTAANNVEGIGATATANLNAFNPLSVNATKAYGTALGTDPFTDTYSTTALSDATNGSTAAYTSAKAALSADLASRGIGSGVSSALVGGEANINAGQAGTMATAAQQLAQLKVQQHLSQLGEQANLYSGAQQTAEGQATGANAEQGQLLEGQSSVLGQTAGENLSQEQIALQQQQQQEAAFASLIGGVAGAAGTILAPPSAAARAASAASGQGVQTGSSSPPINYWNPNASGAAAPNPYGFLLNPANQPPSDLWALAGA